MTCDKTMNANSGSIAHHDEKREIGKEKWIKYREDSHGPDTPVQDKDTVDESETIKEIYETAIDNQDNAKFSQTQTKEGMPVNNILLEDMKICETELCDDFFDLNINIVPGECPGTVDIFIVTSDDETSGQSEKTTVDVDVNHVEALERSEERHKGVDTAGQSDMLEALSKIPISIDADERRPDVKQSEKVAASSCKESSTDQATRTSNNRQTSKQKEVVILSRKSPNKSRKSQSSPCLAESKKISSCDPSKLKQDAVDHEHCAPDQPNTSKHLPKRNQDSTEQLGKMKRFKGTSDLLVVKRQGASERGDFTYSDRENEQKRSILDDVDDAIPRVIPRSGGKQVKFGDEMGSRLIQPSPEKGGPSEEPSPNKAEKSILKKGLSSDGSCIEPQVYYNSSYVDEDSDGRDSGLPEDEDYRPCPEYRDSRYPGYEYPDYQPVSLDTTSGTNIYQHGQCNAHVHSEFSRDVGGHGTCRSPRYFHSQRSQSGSQIGDFSGRQAQAPIYRNRDVYEDYYQTDNQYVRRSPGSYPWSTQTEAYSRENQYCLPTFDTSAFSNTKKASKKKSDKKSRRDKKLQTGKKGRTETDIERYQRQLSTGQVRLASRGNFDVRRIRLEYLLHIGDFSMKYKTEPSPLESMTLTVYNEAEGTSVDVRHMLQMQSNFINRLRFCLRRDQEIWLLHRFLPIGALEILMSRDPYREVLGEVHAQFITAGLLIGVNYLHQNGITHGNLYPWKVLINDRGYPVLTGFLPLVDSEDPVTSDLRQRRRYVFTVPYAAPDRFMGDMHPSVDIFSIGCIAYEIVAGRTPFDGGSEARTKELILSFSYRPTYEYDMFSFAGEMFIDSCLRKPSAHRFLPGRHLANLYHEEWFSTLDLGRYEDQTLESPILDTIQLLHTGETLDQDERNLNYDWGRVMDAVSPHTPTLVC